ncbi:hypothetical protein FACS1894169_02180 [Bacteroidia bacterium]|nr:hypothetical protein FACS1894169_02180 [Bacteroidia bacterium]
MANIFMLAHAVVPHSHHDGIICFSLQELAHQKQSSSQQNESDCCTHNAKSHHHPRTIDGCDLKDVVMRQNDDVHDEIVPCANCLSLLFTFYTLNEFCLETPLLEEILPQRPYIENYTSPLVGLISGLRAPPASYFLG